MDRRAFLLTSTATATCLVDQAASGAGPPKEKRVPLRTKIAVNPGWFPGSHVEQIEQIAAHGFPAFETLGCGRWQDKGEVRARCKELGIQCGAVGGIGTITDWGPVEPANHGRFVLQVKQAIANAKAIGSQRVLALSGPARQGVTREAQMEALARAGRLVAPLLEEAELVMVWECLNVLVDHPGYFLVRSAEGAELVQRTGHRSVKFLFDIYHQQISEGNLINNIKKYHAEIGHYHFADNPGRHEPGTGEINYQNVFKAIHETGYHDLVACEFGKTRPTEQILEILATCDQW